MPILMTCLVLAGGTCIYPTFQRWGCAGKHDRDIGYLCTKQRHIPCLIGGHIFLFITCIMFFIDNNQPKLGKGQKQCGTRTCHNQRLTLCNLSPKRPPFCIGNRGMPQGGSKTEPLFKSVLPSSRQRNFWEQD